MKYLFVGVLTAIVLIVVAVQHGVGPADFFAGNLEVHCKVDPAVAGYMSLKDVPVDVDNEIDALLPDQHCNAITPERLRKVLHDIYRAKGPSGTEGQSGGGGSEGGAWNGKYRNL